MNRGYAYYRSGDYSKALIDFTACVDLNPSWALAYYNRGIHYRILRCMGSILK
jgi:tetratricopeptide (TPR) repeat protein